MRLELFVLAAASFSLFSCLLELCPSLEKENKKQGRERKKLYTLFLNGDKCSYFFFHLDDWLLMPPCKVKVLILELSGYDQGKED